MNQDNNNTSSFEDLSFQNNGNNVNINNNNLNNGNIVNNNEVPELLDVGGSNNQEPVMVQPVINNTPSVVEEVTTTNNIEPVIVQEEVVTPTISNPSSLNDVNKQEEISEPTIVSNVEPTIVQNNITSSPSGTSATDFNDNQSPLTPSTTSITDTVNMESSTPLLQPVVVQADSTQETNLEETKIPEFKPVTVSPNMNDGGIDSVNINSQPSMATINATPRDPIGIPTMKTMPSNDGSVPTKSETENLKRVEVEYKPPSKFKLVILILFFAGLIAFVMFLPEIKEYVEDFQNRGKKNETEKITTGRLKCSLKSNTKTLDKNYDLVFKFTDNKLEKTEFTITNKGDPTSDEKELDELESSCKILEKAAESLDGLYVKCSNKTGILTEVQNMDLKELDLEKLDSAFTEAGANNPEYKYQQDMDEIEKQMNASGYTCKREG